MPKGCPNCGTENADAARFCRGCGCSLNPAPSPDTLSAPYDVGCHACGTQNVAGARFCAKCGADQTPITVPGGLTNAPLPPPSSAPSLFAKTLHGGDADAAPSDDIASDSPARPLGLWIGLAVVAVALIGGAWWLKNSNSPEVRPGDPAASAPAAAVTAAPATVAPATTPAPASMPTPASAPNPTPAPVPATAAAPVVEAPAPAAVPPVVAAPPVADAASAAALAKAKAAARVKAQREQAASAAAATHLAEQEAARRRADEARARAVPDAAPPAQAAPVPAAVPGPRTAQELCAGGNLFTRGICESRECARNEHSDEPLCRRLRAAEDKRRDQN